VSAADLVAQLAEAGTPPQLLAAVAKELFAAEVEREALANRRQHERNRKARSREVTPCHVTGAEVTGTPPLSLDKETPPTPPKEINSKPPVTGTRAREGHRLPDDWKPQKLDRETASGQIVQNRGQEWAKRALESFKNHWRSANGPNARKRDWQAAFANWIIEQDNRDGRRSGTDTVGGNNRNGGSASGMGRTIDAAQRFVARGGPN
jgi:hypothetical protein